MIYKFVFEPIEDLDQTASLQVLYIKARVQSLFKVIRHWDVQMDLNICYVHMTTCIRLIHMHTTASCTNNIFTL